MSQVETQEIEVFFGGKNVNRRNLFFKPGVNSIAPVFIGKSAFFLAEAAYADAIARPRDTDGACIARDEKHIENEGYTFSDDGSPKPLVFSFLVSVSALTAVGVDIEAAKRAGKFKMTGKIRVAIRDNGQLNSLSNE